MPADQRSGDEDELLREPEASAALAEVDANEAGSNATMLGTVMGIANNVVGAGMLSLPWCLMQASLIPGLTLMVGISALAALSVVVICASADLAGGVYTFKELGARAVGPGFGVFLQVVVALYTLGSCISYAVLLLDFIPNILEGISGQQGEWWESRWFIILVLAGLVLLPMSLFRDLSRFEFTSTIAVVCVMLTVGILLWRGSNPSGWDSVVLAEFTPGTFAAMPILAVATTMHYNSLRFYRELPLEHRNLRTMAFITAGAFGICLVAYGASATAGYIAFGADTNAEVLQNFPTSLDNVEGVLALTVRSAFAIVVAFTYPLSLHPLRAAMFTLLPDRLVCGKASRSTASLYIPLTVFLVALTCLVGWLVPDIDVVLDYKGAIAGSCIVFIGPGIMYAALALRGPVATAGATAGPTAKDTALNSSSGASLAESPLLSEGAGHAAKPSDASGHEAAELEGCDCCTRAGCGCAGQVAFLCGGSRNGSGRPADRVAVCGGEWWSLFCGRVCLSWAGVMAIGFVLWGGGPMLIGGVLKTAGALT
ncbi:hypothetical protein FNF31_02265 [Cafeteria roenbergensis]|uniref:Amino acid transporter transmembrane domain-containing protein n=2 Tax=Cafeteria roenbergensis TaxID=33653 RepID=A0A5A8DHJ3_CAFRO|nr:hypothetical protein FNF31_02265 [Cafeteria roenbergensis]